MMMSSLEIRALVEQALQKVSYPSAPQGLYEPIRYVLSVGGKRVRPVLLLLAYNQYRDDVQAALSAAVGLETYHNYTLLHDDLMDRAPLRRGQATVHCRWNDNTAILSGDTMLVLAYKHFLSLSSPAFNEVLHLFTQTAVEIGEGQQMDINFETRNDVSEEEYLEMIRLKTSVLLACALKCGALLGGASPEDAARFYQGGERIGLAFQLQDDYLDVYGDVKVFGKKIGGDILCNKKTYMLIQALRLAEGETRKALNDWLCRTDYVPEEKVRAVTAIYDALGVKEKALSLIDRYFQEGLQCLCEVSLPEERKEPLLRYVSSLLGRTY